MASLHRLKNQFSVVADPMPSLETVAVGVWIHAGSVDERVDADHHEHGLAHLLEHMAFKGTKTRNAQTIAETIERVGGYMNAATSHQRTGYYIRVLKEHLALATEVLADILQNSVFDARELEREQQVVLQEIGEVADTPDDVVFENLQAVSWGEHSLARPILGTRESVLAQSRESLNAFVARHYQPSKMVLSVAGACTQDGVIALAEQFFGAAQSSVPTARSAPVFVGGVRQDHRDIEQSHLAFSFPGASARQDEYFATRIFSDILGGGMASRLFQSLRERHGLAYSVYAFADGYEQSGLVGAYIGADHEKVEQASALIGQEIKALIDNVSTDDVARARAMLRASLMMSRESPAARIDSAAGQLFTYGRLRSSDELTQMLDKVGLEDVRQAAQAVISSGKMGVSLVGRGDAQACADAMRGALA